MDKDDFNEAVKEKVKEHHSKLNPYKPISDEQFISQQIISFLERIRNNTDFQLIIQKNN